MSIGIAPIPKSVLAGIPLEISPSSRSGLPERKKATLDFAESLLEAKVLRQSDWDGRTVESSIAAGVRRWINHEIGARTLQIFSPFGLAYGCDLAQYFTALDDSVWRAEFGGPTTGDSEASIAFFALSWNTDGFLPLNVKDRVLELEAALPGCGYGLLDLLGFAFRWSCNGCGFDWGRQMAESAEEANLSELLAAGQVAEAVAEAVDDPEQAAALRNEHLDREQAGFETPTMQYFTELLENLPEGQRGEQLRRAVRMMGRHIDETAISAKRFHKRVPRACVETRFDWKRHQEHVKQSRADKKKRKYSALLGRIDNLLRLLNDSSRTFTGCSHLPLIGNGHFRGPVTANSSIYLRWDDKDDMERMIDDVYGEALRMGNLPDLSWMHGFQIGHPGRVSKSYRESQRDRKLINSFRMLDLTLADPEKDTPHGKWRAGADGSVEIAVQGVKRAIDILRELDYILQWLAAPGWRELIAGAVDPLSGKAPGDFPGDAEMLEFAARKNRSRALAWTL